MLFRFLIHLPYLMAPKSAETFSWWDPGTHPDLFGVDGAATCRCTTIRTWSPQQSTSTPQDPQFFCITRLLVSPGFSQLLGPSVLGLQAHWLSSVWPLEPLEADQQCAHAVQGHTPGGQAGTGAQQELSSASWPLCPKQGSAKARVPVRQDSQAWTLEVRLTGSTHHNCTLFYEGFCFICILRTWLQHNNESLKWITAIGGTGTWEA